MQMAEGLAVTLPRGRLCGLLCVLLCGLLCVLLCGLLGGQTSLAAEPPWNRFRGPNGAGVSPARLPDDWAERAFAWQVRLPGVGHSSPVVWGQTLLVTSGDEQTGERILECRDLRGGQVRWSRRFMAAANRKHKLNSFASSTPAVDERHVYWAWATPEQFLITALDHQGQQVWQTDLGPFKAGHGDGVSPIVHDGLVVVPSEHSGDSALYALDGASGQIRWKIDRQSGSHYATPCVFAPRGGPASLIFTNWEQGIVAVDPAKGTVRWQADVFDKEHVESSIGSPVIAGDLVIGVCGYLGYGNEVVAVRPNREPGGEPGREPGGEPGSEPGSEPGRAGAERVWRIDRGAPLCTTPVVKDDLLFLWSDNGIASCVEVATGQVHWQQRVGGTFYASPICLGDRLLNVSADGDLFVLAAQRAYQRLGRRELGELSHSTATVADGLLLLRTASQLLALPLDAAPAP